MRVEKKWVILPIALLSIVFLAGCIKQEPECVVDSDCGELHTYGQSWKCVSGKCAEIYIPYFQIADECLNDGGMYVFDYGTMTINETAWMEVNSPIKTDIECLSYGGSCGPERIISSTTIGKCGVEDCWIPDVWEEPGKCLMPKNVIWIIQDGNCVPSVGCPLGWTCWDTEESCESFIEENITCEISGLMGNCSANLENNKQCIGQYKVKCEELCEWNRTGYPKYCYGKFCWTVYGKCPGNQQCQIVAGDWTCVGEQTEYYEWSKAYGGGVRHWRLAFFVYRNSDFKTQQMLEVYANIFKEYLNGCDGSDVKQIKIRYVSPATDVVNDPEMANLDYWEQDVNWYMGGCLIEEEFGLQDNILDAIWTSANLPIDSFISESGMLITDYRENLTVTIQ